MSLRLWLRVKTDLRYWSNSNLVCVIILFIVYSFFLFLYHVLPISANKGVCRLAMT